MGMLLATRLKNKRKELKLSQKELAKGICEQGQISRMEQGKYSPGSELLFQLSKRLKVSMNYFFEETEVSSLENIDKFKELSKRFLDEREYESLHYIYELEKSKRARLSAKDQIYLDWIDTLVQFHYLNHQTEAVAKLEKILLSLKKSDFYYLQLGNTLANFYFDMGQEDTYQELYQLLKENIQSLSVHHLEQLELMIKFRYNYCRYLWLNEQTSEAIEEITETIAICKRYNSSYRLADLYCLLGNISVGFAEKDRILGFYQVSYQLYKHEENQRMMMEIEKEMKLLESED